MSTQASKYFSDQMPSFSSVYEEGSKSQNNETGSLEKDVSASSPYGSGEFPGHIRGHISRTSISTPYSAYHLHRGSASTSASESTSSSPITVASLTESQSTFDTPAASPDTPASSHSLSSLSPSVGMRANHSASPVTSTLGPNELRRPSPPKKARNLKGLAVDTTSAMALGRAMTSGDLSSQETKDSSQPAAPIAPSFTKPLKTPLRKTSNLSLTIVTPSSETSSPQLEKPPGLSQALEQITESPQTKEPSVPPTPSLQRPSLLRNHYSSPLFVVRSPGGGPDGGMRLPPLATQGSVPVGFSEPPPDHGEDCGSQQVDLPHSREEKPSPYPDGPICIYDPHVYLFYEPSVEMASNYDVVFNVASEVQNPFHAMDKRNSAEKEKEQDQEPNTGYFTPNETSSPSTPKASEPASKNQIEKSTKRPEYIHKPWEHNTDIVPDLYDLVKTIDHYVQQGKRILIHCQLGVSRSASLIVAYGLYKNPSITVQEAYDAVKRRSKWICPNMNLIMQLQEFRTGLLKSSAGLPIFGPQQTNSQVMFSRPKTSNLLSSLSSDDAAIRPPQSAPLPPETGKISPAPISTESGKKVNPGPSSAPSGINWPSESSQSSSARNSSEPGQTHRASSIPSPASHSYKPSIFTKKSESPTQATFPLNNEKPVFKPFSFGIKNHKPPPLNIAPDSKSPPHLQTKKYSTTEEQKLDDGFGLTSPRPIDTKNTSMTMQSQLQEDIAPVQNSVRPTSTDVATQRSDEFAMTSIKPPEVDETFGLTSPRPVPPPNVTEPIQDYFQQKRDAYSVDDDTLMSPRTQHFAMTSVHPPVQDDGLGLTSPRPTTFTMQLPVRQPLPQLERGRQISALHPPDESEVPDSILARRELKSKLGMATRSNYDMRHDYALSQKARRLAPSTLPAMPPLPSIGKKRDAEEPLMSPRAAEIINNPFDSMKSHNMAASAFNKSSTLAESRSENATPKPSPAADPRSPPQPGPTTITMNILDVL